MRENMLLQYADDIIKVEIGSLRGEMLRLVDPSAHLQSQTGSHVLVNPAMMDTGGRRQGSGKTQGFDQGPFIPAEVSPACVNMLDSRDGA